ncbi:MULTISPECIES: endolytic transglycosylase MltG [unclassified Streptomyces]|uniref:endolytic transglycosylase MltG n=1 Tax=unclassified Streptomyces TaxID=2593676 RepID=UPI000376058A|nr:MULTISPECIES: endolytic transglycosylase MltG [unclassified Streptomyces]MYQ77212.1 endolytic transglycosylase MltG [Streptomyces sp. SID4923]
MTEYGRGPGSEPWHPEDPLYGDQGWGGQQPAHGQAQYDGQNQYDGTNQYGAQQQYPQGQYDPYQQQPQDPYAQQQYQQQDPYQQQPQHHQQQDPYAQQYQQQAYGNQHPQDPYGQQPQQPQPGYDTGWDTGQQAVPPYEGQPVATYGYGETNDYYGTPEAYPPPQPPGRREAAPAEAPEAAPDWDPEEPPEETHPFFTGVDEKDDRKKPRDDDYDDEDDDRDSGGGGERRGKGKKKKGRSGCACLVVSLVLVAGVGGAGYFGYSFYQDRFGPAPDYSGSGSGSVEVEIPKGAFGYDIGNILKKAGVVKSVDAFVSAQNENPKGKGIQAGVYLLHSQMSASEAVKMMVDPKSQNLLVIPEGKRNSAVYALIDTRLGLKKGTTADVAADKSGSLGLPDWAKGHAKIKDPLEGFLYPAAYSVTKGMKPETVLKEMVDRANEEYKKLDLAGTAKKYKLEGPWQVITAASLVQAEGKTHDDFRKMAEVIYNRLKPDNTQTNQMLQFDSSYNYLKKQSEINISLEEIRKNPDPYNTYKYRGLTPGPIGNPGNEALAATLHPTTDGWLYFVATDGMHKTEFAKTYDEFLKLKAKFDAGN